MSLLSQFTQRVPPDRPRTIESALVDVDDTIGEIDVVFADVASGVNRRQRRRTVRRVRQRL